MKSEKRKGASQLSRREVLRGFTAGCTAPLWAWCADAASTTNKYTFECGKFQVSVFNDGFLTVPTRFLARNVTEAEIKTWLGHSADTITPACNVTVLQTPSDMILIDVGAGPHFMPNSGKLAENMELAGIDRKAVTKVVFSHAHPDHLWGTLDDFDNEPMFPNASYVISAAEWNFWMADNVASRLPEDRQNFAPGARRNLSRIKDRLRTLTPGDDIAAGVRTIDTSGHTPGHISVEASSAGEAVIVLGDALTHPTISFAHPEWQPAADHYDPDAAVATRKSLLARLATDRTRTIGYHLPFPGVGHVESRGAAYRFVPIG